MTFARSVLKTLLVISATAYGASVNYEDTPAETLTYETPNYGVTTTVASETLETSDLDGSKQASSVYSCDPLSASGCSADPALATAIADDFKKESSHYSAYHFPKRITYGDDGVNFTLAKQLDNPSLVSDYYIMFGRLEVELKSAAGTGIISSFYLQSDDLDEIDLEWFGGKGEEVQSNFFSKGNTSTYDRGEYHTISDARAEYHNYTIDWTPSALKWYFDGKLLRTLANDTSSGYPQSPMRVFFGIWAGGDSSNSEGVIEWAGGATDYSKAPFVMGVKRLVVSDYSSGSEYKYSDKSGDWSSIQAVNGKVMGRSDKGSSEFVALAAGDSTTGDDGDSNSSSDASETESTGSSETESGSLPSLSADSDTQSESDVGATSSEAAAASTLSSVYTSATSSSSASKASTISSSALANNLIPNVGRSSTAAFAIALLLSIM